MHPPTAAMFFGVPSSVTECFQSVTDYLQPVTELGTLKNMTANLPGMTLQLLHTLACILLYTRSYFLRMRYITAGLTIYNISRFQTQRISCRYLYKL